MLLISLTGNVIYWAFQKEGFHVDEMFSYEQVGNTEYPKPEYDRPNEPCMNTWHSRAYYEDYLNVSSEEAFDISAFYRAASKNTAHPPLYLILLGMYISVFFQNNFTKWSGISLNIVFYILTLIVFHYLSRRVLKKEKLALLCTGLYGASIGAVTTCIFIRVYMILTFFSTVFICLHVRMLDRKPDISMPFIKRFPFYIGIVLVFVLGSLSQYYFLVFSFFVCLVYCLILLFAREYRLLIEYILAEGIGLIAYFCVWPNFFRDLFSSERGVEAIGNLSGSANNFAIQLANYIDTTSNMLTGGYGFLLLVILLTAILLKYIHEHDITCHLNGNGTFELSHAVSLSKLPTQKWTIGAEWLMFLLVALSTVGYVCMITQIAPILLFDTYKDVRYIFNVFPCIMVMLMFMLEKILLHCFKARLWRITICSVAVLLMLSGYLSYGVDYLYRGADAQLEILEEYAGDRVIFISEMPYFASNLNNYFTKTKAVYQTNHSGLSSLKDAFISFKEKEILIFISDDTESIDQILPEINRTFHATDCRYLFDTVGRHTAQVYVLTL